MDYVDLEDKENCLTRPRCEKQKTQKTLLQLNFFKNNNPVFESPEPHASQPIEELIDFPIAVVSDDSEQTGVAKEAEELSATQLWGPSQPSVSPRKPSVSPTQPWVDSGKSASSPTESPARPWVISDSISLASPQVISPMKELVDSGTGWSPKSVPDVGDAEHKLSHVEEIGGTSSADPFLSKADQGDDQLPLSDGRDLMKDEVPLLPNPEDMKVPHGGIATQLATPRSPVVHDTASEGTVGGGPGGTQDTVVDAQEGVEDELYHVDVNLSLEEIGETSAAAPFLSKADQGDDQLLVNDEQDLVKDELSHVEVSMSHEEVSGTSSAGSFLPTKHTKCAEEELSHGEVNTSHEEVSGTSSAGSFLSKAGQGDDELLVGNGQDWEHVPAANTSVLNAGELTLSQEFAALLDEDACCPPTQVDSDVEPNPVQIPSETHARAQPIGAAEENQPVTEDGNCAAHASKRRRLRGKTTLARPQPTSEAKVAPVDRDPSQCVRLIDNASSEHEKEEAARVGSVVCDHQNQQIAAKDTSTSHWDTCWERLSQQGWKIAHGPRGDKYYMPPGVKRGPGVSCRKDYFDSKSQVLKHIGSVDKPQESSAKKPACSSVSSVVVEQVSGACSANKRPCGPATSVVVQQSSGTCSANKRASGPATSVVVEKVRGKKRDREPRSEDQPCRKIVAKAPALNDAKTNDWDQLWESLSAKGWTIEFGPKGEGKQVYYMPPGVKKGPGKSCRVHYFDSKKQVMAHVEKTSE